MYKLNLYPEYELKRAQKRRGAVLAGCLAVVAGLQVALIASQFLNANTAGQQVALLQQELPRLEQMIEKEKQPSPEIVMARELIELRRGRMDWTPALASLSNAVDQSLFLTKITASLGVGGEDPSLAITGETRSETEQLETLSVLMGRLRSDDAFRSALAAVSLGKVQSGDSGEFELTCRRGGDAQ